jgi:hypothetical protein
MSCTFNHCIVQSPRLMKQMCNFRYCTFPLFSGIHRNGSLHSVAWKVKNESEPVALLLQRIEARCHRNRLMPRLLSQSKHWRYQRPLWSRRNRPLFDSKSFPCSKTSPQNHSQCHFDWLAELQSGRGTSANNSRKARFERMLKK